ncbi:MAG: aminoacetone oxidase family FAD-binding enzyme, partial [Bacteroidetes bacterium]|nr:aminoacetone oxidase family FAD-binding enzyme [Bacteroidota bacterium]
RGEKQLKSAFSRFTTTDTVNWFQDKKVKLKTEVDGRVFPVSDDSQTIIDCLEKEVKKLKIEIKLEADVKKIIPTYSGGFELALASGDRITCNKLIIASGGSPKSENMQWLKELGHEIIEPVPSLFTFNIPNEALNLLTGISVNPIKVKIADTKFEFSGPVLITHWGLSGPTILKLSSFAARNLAEKDYQFKIQLNWLNDKKEEACRNELMNVKAANPHKQVNNHFPFKLPTRLLSHLFIKSGIVETLRWADISKIDIQQLVQNLIYDTYEVQGKTSFKEEFVTCGGISLNDIEFKNMQSKRCKNLYFAGEILDIDGITGGFNFQAAWTTGFIAGNAAASV